MSARTPRPMRSTRSLLFEKLNPILDQEKTRDAYRLEVDLLPMVLEMRRRGIRIDQDAAEQARDLLLGKRDAALAELSSQLGAAVSMAEINSSKWKAKAFDANTASTYPRTPKGNPSFAAGKSGWMAKHGHWLPRGIATASQVRCRRHQVCRRPHPQSHRERAHSRRNSSIPRRRRRHAIVAICLLQSAAAANAVTRSRNSGR